MTLATISNHSVFINQKPLVQVFSATLRAGDFWVVLGPSGCGKTSLIKSLSHTSETVALNSEWCEVPQDGALNPEGTALSAALLGWRKRRGLWENIVGPASSIQKKALDLLERFGISDPYSKIKTLSGGERQRVSIVRAIIEPWRILFLDEPISALDRTWAEIVLDEVKEQALVRGAAVVCVLHDENLAHKYSTHIYKFSGDGQVIPYDLSIQR